MSVRNFSVRNFLMMITCAVGLTAGWASSGWAQSTDISFGTAAPDRDEPIEVTAETLLINQDEGTAEYLGDVVIQQGDMRLTAPR
ncbi:MAG: LptA/OstA family protein, partial [Paracoccaceae bacterium]